MFWKLEKSMLFLSRKQLSKDEDSFNAWSFFCCVGTNRIFTLDLLQTLQVILHELQVLYFDMIVKNVFTDFLFLYILLPSNLFLKGRSRHEDSNTMETSLFL